MTPAKSLATKLRKLWFGRSCGQRLHSLNSTHPGAPRAGGAKIIKLKVGIVGENLFVGHFTAHQFEQKFNRITQAPDAGFSMANTRIHGDW